ncbi:hypothetical protein [Halomonas sp. I5-271120]|uniref:hypothetical protein n=1 Tax=Halomonas sp. I5-271120 TaxID=3061632 RepID=UPI0027153F4B|nr:hypothetical protein [Halomonas sp. I5-271120]
MQAHFELALETDTFVLILDADGPKSITNDAGRVVPRVEAMVGGLGRRKLYYRDSDGRFDQLQTSNGRYTSIAPCSPHQQSILSEWLEETHAGHAHPTPGRTRFT